MEKNLTFEKRRFERDFLWFPPTQFLLRGGGKIKRKGLL